MFNTVFSKYLRPVAVNLALMMAGVVIVALACDDDLGDILDWQSRLEPPSVDIPLSVVRTAWHTAAEPYQIEGEGYARGKLLWHRPRELRTYESVWDAETAPGEGTLRTLRFIYRPVGSGTKSWAGVTTCLNRDIPDTISYFDIRVLGSRGLIHLDFGEVSEDLNDDGVAYTEDLDCNAVVSEEEDVGLDGIADGQGEVLSLWGTADDPAGDNWYFRGEGKCPFGDGCDTIDWDSDEWYYEFLNGTEGNIRDASAAGVPDAEMLGSDRTLNKNDICFSWTIDLAGDQFMLEGSEHNGWRTFRLPIGDGSPVDTVTSTDRIPFWYHVEHIRVWLESDESQAFPDTIEVADWRFVPAEE